MVAVTAHAMAGDREKILSSGFDSYVSKPVDIDHLVSVLRVSIDSFADLAPEVPGIDIAFATRPANAVAGDPRRDDGIHLSQVGDDALESTFVHACRQRCEHECEPAHDGRQLRHACRL